METVLIADDHQIVRRGVRMILESLPQKFHIIEAGTCAEVKEAISQHHIQYAVLDMSMPDGNIFSAIELNLAESRQTNILVYSMNAEKIYAKRLMQKGVRGFVSKQAPIEELEIALQSVLKGEIYLSAHMKEELFEPAKSTSSENPIGLLSDRELEVIEYVAMGMGSKEIAGRMNLDITTISTYRRRAFDKLGVQNAIELKEKFLLYKV
jgi:two-component system, NarL family, invasion response regulator UvrY